MSGGKRSDKNVTVNFAIGGYGAATTKPANDNVASVASGSGSGTRGTWAQEKGVKSFVLDV